MATKTLTATLMTPVRNGVSSTPSGYDVGGPGSGSDYNNSIYMTFPSFGLEAGSTISSAAMSYTMTGYDWKAAVTMHLQACASAGTPSNQVGCTGTADSTSVPESTLTSSYAATNTAKQMYASGKYYLKMYCSNGDNRKNYSSTKAILTVNYTPPTAPTAPTGVSASPSTFEGSLGVSWTKGTNGTNNPITGYDVQYQTSSNNSTWSSTTSLSAGSSATLLSLPASTVNGIARGYYVRFRIGSKSAYASTVYSGWNTVRKNQLPNVPKNVGTSKTCYAPGETIRVTFTNAGDPDNNLKGYEVARADSDTVIASNYISTAAYVDVSTSSGTWTPGVLYTLRVRAKDSLGAVSGWVATPAVMVGLPLFVQPTAGDGFRRAVSMKVYVADQGFKTVKSVSIAPTPGAISNKVF